MKKRYQIISDLESIIWNSKNQSAILEWDQYTDELPLGYWKDLNDYSIELAINFAELIIQQYRINNVSVHYFGKSQNLVFD
jgi:hypothetical protein